MPTTIIDGPKRAIKVIILDYHLLPITYHCCFNKGWSFAEVLPYFKKMERIGIEEFKTSKYRGTKGNVDVQHPGYHSELLDAFFEAGKEFGYEVNDPNDEQMLGFSQVQATTRLVNLYLITRNGNFDEIFH